METGVAGTGFLPTRHRPTPQLGYVASADLTKNTPVRCRNLLSIIPEVYLQISGVI
jgi:hypothetical protein